MTGEIGLIRILLVALGVAIALRIARDYVVESRRVGVSDGGRQKLRRMFLSALTTAIGSLLIGFILVRLGLPSRVGLIFVGISLIASAVLVVTTARIFWKG